MSTSTIDASLEDKADLFREEWQKRGRELAADDSNRRFMIGDWIAEGAAKWDHTVYIMAGAIFPNMQKATLRNLAFVARAVPTSLRNDVLSWSHHTAVAAFADQPDIQKELLDYAADAILSDEGMTVAEFRRHINKKYPADNCPSNNPSTSQPTLDSSITLTLSPNELVKVECLAKKWQESVENAIYHLIERALELPDIKQDLPAADEAA